MPRLQSLRGSFGSPPHKEPTLRGGLGGHSPPACLRRKQTSPSSTSLVRQDLQRKGASWEGRLQMDPDSLLKVLVEIIKALPARQKYGAFFQYVPSERFALRSKEHRPRSSAS